MDMSDFLYMYVAMPMAPGLNACTLFSSILSGALMNEKLEKFESLFSEIVQSFRIFENETF